MSQEVFNEGPTTSQHIEAEDDDHFNKTTFKLKRTRSMGLLDDFITQTHSLDTDSIPDKEARLSSKDFVSDETLHKLNMKSTLDETENVPRFYTSVVPSASKSKKTFPSYSPQSFQSEETSDENCFSEDSLSSTGSANSVSLVPKHQLKRYQHGKQNETLVPSVAFQQHLHDDIDVQHSPEQHVDYLSHNWDELEISKSWRYVTLKRNDFANSARLENASWRTWAQARNGLKTISPAELNWSKESDVTWLYGPLYKEDKYGFDIVDFKKQQHKKRQESSGGSSKGNVDIEAPTKDTSTMKDDDRDNNEQDKHSDHLKPILKKRSNVEKMISDASYSRLQSLLEEHDHKFKGSPVLEPFSNPMNDSSSPANSSTNHTNNEDASPFSLSANQTSEDVHKVDGQAQQNPLANKKERKIHFNMRVDQCIAIDDTESDADTNCQNDSDDEGPSRTILRSKNNIDDDEDMGYDEEDDDDGDDEGGFMLHTRVTSPNISHRPPNWSRNSSGANTRDVSPSSGNLKPIATIAPLPATTLKTCSDDDESDPYTVSHNTKTNRGYDYYYDYNTVYDDSTNPLYSVINSQQNVQLFDVPESCQIEDVMDVDANGHPENLIISPVGARSETENAASTSSQLVHEDIPSHLQKFIPSEVSDQPLRYQKPQQPENSPVSCSQIKRNTSVGHGSSSSNSNISASLSTIKVGLSGLDLGPTGLRRSLGSGSKPQLYEMSEQSGGSQFSIPGSSASMSLDHKKFVFSSDSDDSSCSDEEMEINPPRRPTSLSP
ncbi:hypothetical protein KL905_005131 [Ogataea polymorpha]|uniref:Uncharacterized protein n=3 Tax=Saccharomycotina TaxID=147537 RepID=A0A1B7SQ81_9ASCO|nr:uncharacterized protein OGAPODRAFT_74786 [Ogataea polymorpha]KAG7888135.1 hypothetical protein KL908_005191 [Ogataea polymorpha]KAG7897454.1 hypothetical protein KL935_005079 [Ogataea polymorpha]KAG7905379.1 hypothetical protein KL906_005045 [Ogataea polymorpha]KAG7913898.1 hypothetical protein KL927_005124 [Ogataea polymorpha]KAG7915029.1 hypothetical protein KL905_005131 [Ogataea polymorpha]